MMEILKAVGELNLPDWWVGAGFVRSKVWDILHNYEIRTPLPDIDVIYFDPNDFSHTEKGSFSTKAEDRYQDLLKKMLPNIQWSVTNQARMHASHDDKPYRSSEEGLSHWVETATCIGVTLNRNGKLVLIAPFGIADLVNLIVRPSPSFQTNLTVFYDRIEKKKWLKKWPKLQVYSATSE